MPDIAAVIFDMDGVLADSQKLHTLAEVETCAHFGVPVTAERMEKDAGKPDAMTFLELLTEHGKPPDLVDSMMRYKYREAMPRIIRERGMPPIEGALAVVEFATRNFHCAVASSSTHDFINFLLAKLGLAEMLPVRVSNDDLPPGRGKPHPDIYLLAAGRLGVDPKRCLVIEDAAHGVAAAKAAGMFCIGFQSPHSGKQNLSEADIVVERMEDIPPLLPPEKGTGNH